MKRSQFNVAVLSLCEYLKVEEIFVIGSQSILGTYPDDKLPKINTYSAELDATMWEDDLLRVGVTSEQVSHAISSGFGQDTDFHREYGIYIDGVSLTTPTLARGWKDRLVKYRIAGKTALCIDPYDLCVAKIAITDTRERDTPFVIALIRDGRINPTLLLELFQLPLENSQMNDTMYNNRVDLLKSFIEKYTTSLPKHKLVSGRIRR